MYPTSDRFGVPIPEGRASGVVVPVKAANKACAAQAATRDDRVTEQGDERKREKNKRRRADRKQEDKALERVEGATPKVEAAVRNNRWICSVMSPDEVAGISVPFKHIKARLRAVL